MRTIRVLLLLTTAIVLAGCGEMASNVADSNEPHGRYGGVGIYGAGKVWSHLKVADESTDPNAATIKDDDAVIVVVDSKTGEVRECGNYSGYCTNIQPWAKFVAGTPVKVTMHAADIEDSNTSAATVTENASDDPSPKP